MNHSVRTRRRSRLAVALCTLAATLFMLLGPVLTPLRAWAADGYDATITIDESNPIVTATSGYHIKVTITNTSDQEIEAGSLELSTNIAYTFVSRSDIQGWANDTTPIITPNQLGVMDVPTIKPGANATVTFDVANDQVSLAAIPSWGPKPVRLMYTAGNAVRGRTTTFLTRTTDGLNVDTPAMNVTVALPLASTRWQSSEEGMTALLDDQDEDDVTNVLTLTDAAKQNETTLAQSIAKHEKLQVIADPSYLASLSAESTSTPRVTALMQPAMVDITSYAAVNDAGAYEAAGITDAQWSSDAAVAMANNASTTTVAWQGAQPWTTDALTKARAQGYSTVIANDDFDANPTGTVHTGTYTVSTSAGDVTVLKSQAELSLLAQGQASSEQATQETTDAGRLARFMAQSAFYQMEQPYTSRYLLVTLAPDASASWVDSLMSGIEQASWLSLADLNTMASAEAYSTSDQGSQTAVNEDALNTTRSTLDTLKSGTSNINHFSQNLLKADATTQEQASQSTQDADATTNTDESSNSTSESTTDDPQALARQDADTTAKRSLDPKAWIDSLNAAHGYCGMHALSGAANGEYRERMTTAANAIGEDLMNGVHLTPSEAVTLVSETAQMPVTITNELPYAVKVTVHSISNSMQIAASGRQDIDIAAHSSAQVTFTIRAATSGSAVAHVSLTDQQGNAFGNTQDTPITCVMRISDASGFIIIGIAVILGILGLWRQFHRKKGPNE